ncbi:MAG: hypothetical protein J5999_09170 [Oscillospiraceae bacterium]|nr:hypothetical protein [Oscillospiraceae bacterium]
MNRKAIAISAVILMGFSGCSSSVSEGDGITVSEVSVSLTETEATVTETTTEAPPETTAETTEETTTEETTEIDAWEWNRESFDSYAENFLEALSSGNGNVELDTDYEFLNDLRLSDYSIEFVEQNDWSATYNVTVNVTESTDDYIPVGESVWHLVTANGEFGYVMEFYPKKYYEIQTEKMSEKVSSACRLAYNTAFIAEIFDTEETPLDEWQPDGFSRHMFYHAVNLDFWNGVTRKEFVDEVKKVYGLDLTSGKDYSKTDEDALMRRDCGHGATWVDHRITNVSEENGEIMVQLQVFGDYTAFYPVKESKYYFSEREDGTLYLLRAEKVFDKGLPVYVKTV